MSKSQKHVVAGSEGTPERVQTHFLEQGHGHSLSPTLEGQLFVNHVIIKTSEHIGVPSTLPLNFTLINPVSHYRQQMK